MTISVPQMPCTSETTTLEAARVLQSTYYPIQIRVWLQSNYTHTSRMGLQWGNYYRIHSLKHAHFCLINVCVGDKNSHSVPQGTGNFYQYKRIDVHTVLLYFYSLSGVCVFRSHHSRMRGDDHIIFVWEIVPGNVCAHFFNLIAKTTTRAFVLATTRVCFSDTHPVTIAVSGVCNSVFNE